MTSHPFLRTHSVVIHHLWHWMAYGLCWCAIKNLLTHPDVSNYTTLCPDMWLLVWPQKNSYMYWQN